MALYLLAAGWEDFLKVLPIVIGVLVWVISHFAGQVQPKMPQQRRPISQPPQPQPGPPRPGKDSLQVEIDEFLRQAQAAREGRSSNQPRREIQPPPARSPEPQRARPQRRSSSTQARRGARRDETRPVARPAPPPVIEVVEQTPVRQPLTERLDMEKFAQRAAQLSRMPEESDAEFQKHMQRVFAHDVSTLKPAPLGVFEAAAATARQETATAAAAAKESAGGAQSAYAPAIARKQASDIALFLAGRKNIRDAIILNEILSRPESRW